MPAGIIETIFTEVDAILVDFITNTASNLVDFLIPIFNSMAIIWIAIWGIQHILGYSQTPIQEGLKRIITLSAVIGLGLTVGNYTSIIVSFLSGWPEQLAQAITGSGSDSTASIIDNLFSRLFTVVKTSFDKGGVLDGNIGMYFIGLLVAVAGLLFVIVTVPIIVGAKVAIAALLGIGPLAMCLIIFPQTQKFFEGWLSMLINIGMVIVLAVLVTNIVIGVADSIIDARAPTTSDLEGLANLGDALFLACVIGISSVLMKNVPVLSQALGGGISLATQGVISNLADKMRPTSMRRSANRIKRDVRIASETVKKPIKASAAAYQRRFGKQNNVKSADNERD